MAKGNKDLQGWILVAAVLFIAYSMFGTTTTPTIINGDSGDADLCNIIEPEASFTAERMFVKGTAITDEWVRVFKDNGEQKDLGQTSTDSGTLSTVPNAGYRLMHGENSTTYYTQVVDYTAPCQEATDTKVGVLCYIDTDPTVTVKDENDDSQTSSTFAQALTVNDEVDVTVKVKVASDKCFGNPSASGDNAICYKFNNTGLTSVETDTGSSNLPYAATAYAAAGYSINCYNLPKLADKGSVELITTIKSGSSEPGVDHNVTIYLDDIAFDLHADDLTEIWGFHDESNTALGSAIVTGDFIYIS